MVPRLRSWWQTIKQHPFITAGIVVTLLALIVLVIAVVLSNGTGFNGYTVKATATETTLSPQTKVTTTTQSQPGKTLWDLLQLLAALAIPVVVGIGAAWFTAQQDKVSERENRDNQREKALQDYIDKMSELLLKEHLAELTADGKLKAEYDQVRKIARVRTITILFQLDTRRINLVFAFLRESGLMSNKPNGSIVSFSQANLSKINLSQVNLIKADLSGVYLSGADLKWTNLMDADLSGAYLSGANLSGANLMNADLSEAHLSGANLSGADLRFAKLRLACLNGRDLVDLVIELDPSKSPSQTETNRSEANLSQANLAGADLSDARVTDEQLAQAKSLNSATMPDGSTHSGGTIYS